MIEEVAILSSSHLGFVSRRQLYEKQWSAIRPHKLKREVRVDVYRTAESPNVKLSQPGKNDTTPIQLDKS